MMKPTTGLMARTVIHKRCSFKMFDLLWRVETSPSGEMRFNRVVAMKTLACKSFLNSNHHAATEYAGNSI